MKGFQTLLYKDWLELKRKYIFYIFLWFALPMIFYLLLVFPLSKFFFKINLMAYQNWSSPGIWICSSSICCFIYSFIKLKNLIHEKELINKYLKAPISNGELLFSLLFSSVIIGFIQLCISMIITTSLNNDTLLFSQLLTILFNTLSNIVFFSVTGLIFAILVKDNLSSIFICIIVFTFLLFGTGCFIPFEGDVTIELMDSKSITYDVSNRLSANFSMLFKNLPTYQIVLNTQSQYALKTMNMFPLILLNVINIILFIIALVLSYKKFRK